MVSLVRFCPSSFAKRCGYRIADPFEAPCPWPPSIPRMQPASHFEQSPDNETLVDHGRFTQEAVIAVALLGDIRTMSGAPSHDYEQLLEDVAGLHARCVGSVAGRHYPRPSREAPGGRRSWATSQSTRHGSQRGRTDTAVLVFRHRQIYQQNQTFARAQCLVI